MFNRSRLPTLAGVLWLAAGVPQAEAVTDAREAFAAAHQCELERILNTIRDAPIEGGDDQNRFVIAVDARNPNIYAQCALEDGDAFAYCEVASGFYVFPEGAPREHLVAGQRLADLLGLGFDADDAHGNYRRRFRIDRFDLAPLARFLLDALITAFPQIARDRIDYQAPLAGRPDPGSCAPVS